MYILIITVWTRFKKRKIESTTNLLTGETKNKIEVRNSVSTLSFTLQLIFIKFICVNQCWLNTEVTNFRFQGAEDGDIISYWHPNLTISMLDDQRVWPAGQPIPPPFDKCELTVPGPQI